MPGVAASPTASLCVVLLKKWNPPLSVTLKGLLHLLLFVKNKESESDSVPGRINTENATQSAKAQEQIQGF